MPCHATIVRPWRTRLAHWHAPPQTRHKDHDAGGLVVACTARGGGSLLQWIVLCVPVPFEKECAASAYHARRPGVRLLGRDRDEEPIFITEVRPRGESRGS